MHCAVIAKAVVVTFGVLAASPVGAMSPGLPHCVSDEGAQWNLMERLRDGLDVFIVFADQRPLQVEIAQCETARKIVVSGAQPTWKTQYSINMMFRLVADARAFGMEDLTNRLTYGSSVARLEAVTPGTCPCAEEN